MVPTGNAERGPVPVAFVSLVPGGRGDAVELQVWARQNMAPCEVPAVVLVEEFPMTTTGKIPRVELADRAQRLVDAR